MNCLGSPLLPGTSSFLMWYREVEQGENNAKEGQTPITSGIFPLASPFSSPLVILDPIVIFTLEMADYMKYILFLEVCGLDCLMGLLHLSSVIFVFIKYLTPFPFPSPANWDWLRGSLEENELSLELSASLSHSYKRGSHMASALPGKPNHSKLLNIQEEQNKLQIPCLSTNTFFVGGTVLLGDAGSM